MLGAIEAGGTKFVCAVSDNDLKNIKKLSIPTTTPEETFEKVFEFFDGYALDAIGIGSFGPIDVNKESKTYGYITTTPKAGWGHTDFIGQMKERYDVPMSWTTDVNAAAYGELKQGAAAGKQSCLYLTVGTGIGGGAVVNGEVLEGFGHPEMGHILVRLHEKDNYEGNCPYHNNCLEGLAAGPAIEKRYNQKAQYIDKDSKAWDIEAYYLAQALVSYTLTLSPETIILGGGVMKQNQLFPLIRDHFTRLLNNYVSTPDLNDYIVSPKLKDDAGITGCLLLARKELTS